MHGVGLAERLPYDLYPALHLCHFCPAPNRFGLHCSSASNDQAFPFETLTLTTALKSKGYQTAISGKWHLGSLPECGPRKYGFDHSYGALAGAVGMYD